MDNKKLTFLRLFSICFKRKNRVPVRFCISDFVELKKNEKLKNSTAYDERRIATPRKTHFEATSWTWHFNGREKTKDEPRLGAA